MTELWAVFLVLIATFLGAFGSLYFKLASKNLSRNLRKLTKNYALMKGALLYGIASIFYIVALKGGQLSVLYPLVSTSFIWVSFLSIKFLKEKMNREKWTGIFLIILGISFIGLGSF